MGFEVRKTSDYGTAHPVVARLKYQTHDLLQWANLPKEEKIEVTEIYFGMADRLLKCHEVYGGLLDGLKIAIEGVAPSADRRIVNAPHVIGLKAEAETFLYEAKNYLRDLLAIVRVFFGTTFDSASAFYDAKQKGNGKLAEWANIKFGSTDPFTTMLVSEQDWVGELIRKRNAIEHPGGKAGTLHIENFKAARDGQYVPPTWYRDQNAPTLIVTDFELYLDNLLTMAEDMLVSCIVHNTKFGLIQFAEIPPEARNPPCPQRITVVLNKAAIVPTVAEEEPDPSKIS